MAFVPVLVIGFLMGTIFGAVVFSDFDDESLDD